MQSMEIFLSMNNIVKLMRRELLCHTRLVNFCVFCQYEAIELYSVINYK